MIGEVEGKAAVQRGLGRLKKSVNRNLTNFSRNKCKILHEERKNLMQHYKLVANQQAEM